MIRKISTILSFIGKRRLFTLYSTFAFWNFIQMIMLIPMLDSEFESNVVAFIARFKFTLFIFNSSDCKCDSYLIFISMYLQQKYYRSWQYCDSLLMPNWTRRWQSIEEYTSSICNFNICLSCTDRMIYCSCFLFFVRQI